ncbi:MAG TPA: glutathione S-transferase N-terminal domain-containing protein [Myxococcota bacterium]|nr:glutathione S-transferase N-terminal domain-containing protein [Myxococcota bacterium]
MIDLHYWPTPNGWKITIALEELGLPYRIVPVNIGRGEQFKPEFLAISPNNRMPAIVDHDPADGGPPLPVFESGAILIYLAEKTGKLMPKGLRGRVQVLEWVMWQMGGLGPMSGQANHFRNYAPEKIQYGIDRYTAEANRLYGVLDKRLAGREFICGEFSIADCASWPWVVSHERIGQNLAEFPNLARWYEALKQRPSVRRGMDVGKELRTPGVMDEQAKKILFGQTAKSVSRS